MDFWHKARNFAEEAAKKSQELTMEAAKRSQEFTIGSSKFSDIVSEASKRSKEIAAEASKRADQIKSEASKRADQIKSEAIKRADMIKSQLPSAAVLSSFVDSSSSSSSLLSPTPQSEEDLEKFGITDELREFVTGITINTFRDFPLEDDSEIADTPTLSNISQDLSKWQEKHAKLVLSAVKEISKLRYELCPRTMKERRFWRIYFILVCSHIDPYEKRYMKEEEEKEKEKEEKARSAEEVKHEESDGSSKEEPDGVNQKSKRSTSSEQDLDVFLLGDDVCDSDGGTGSADKDFDDDFDKL